MAIQPERAVGVSFGAACLCSAYIEWQNELTGCGPNTSNITLTMQMSTNNSPNAIKKMEKSNRLLSRHY